VQHVKGGLLSHPQRSRRLPALSPEPRGSEIVRSGRLRRPQSERGGSSEPLNWGLGDRCPYHEVRTALACAQRASTGGVTRLIALSGRNPTHPGLTKQGRRSRGNQSGRPSMSMAGALKLAKLSQSEP
jgi:hypothetical protein